MNLVDSSLDSNSVGGDDKLVDELSKLQLRDSVVGALRHSDNGFFDILPVRVVVFVVFDLKPLHVYQFTDTRKMAIINIHNFKFVFN